MNVISIIVPRFRKVTKELQLRNEFYDWPKVDRDNFRLERLNHIWKQALLGSAYYSSLFRNNKLPATFNSLEEFKSLVPVTHRAALRGDPATFKLSGYCRGKWMHTGGSTGIPLKVFWGIEGHLENMCDQYWARSWWGIAPFDRQAMLWGHAHSFGRGVVGLYQKIMVPVVDRLRGRKRFSAYHLEPDTLRKYYDDMARFCPKSIYSYSSALHLLAIANKDRSLSLDSIKVAFLAAEPVLDVYRQSIENVFKCPSAGEYGSIECGMLAYEHPSGHYRIFERSVLVETVEREGGYSILVTQLRDTGFPLFRYEIGDMTSTPIQTIQNDLQVLTDVIGRSHDLLRTPSGDVCHGEMITHIIERIPDIILFNVRQYEDYSVCINFQTANDADIKNDQKQWIFDEIEKILGQDLRISLNKVENLGRTTSGKHRWIVSDIKEHQS